MVRTCASGARYCLILCVSSEILTLHSYKTELESVNSIHHAYKKILKQHGWHWTEVKAVLRRENNSKLDLITC